MTTALERLEEVLDVKDGEIHKLQRRLEKMQLDADVSRLAWCHHSEFDEGTEPNPELPVPRLEIRWSVREGETTAMYSLVYRHLLGRVVFVPLGMTRTSGALDQQVRPNGTITTPFRDGAHFANEMRQLKLPGFVICGDRVHETKMCSRCQRLDEVHHGGGIDDSCSLPVT